MDPDQTAPIGAADLGPHCVLQRRFESISRGHTDDDICLFVTGCAT